MDKTILAELAISPEGHVYLDQSLNSVESLSFHDFNLIQAMFLKGGSFGILQIGIQEFSSLLPPSFQFWRQFSKDFITECCKLNPFSEDKSEVTKYQLPNYIQIQETVKNAPFMKGAEYLNPELLENIWLSLTGCLKKELEQFQNLQNYLHHHNPTLSLIGRVCFHLAENKNNENKPFAFLATYTTSVSENSSLQHLPLRRALQEYAGENNRSSLLSLLLPVQKAASKSPFIKKMLDDGSIFQTLTWDASEAHKFLKEIPMMESSGCVVKVPNWWSQGKKRQARVVVTLGDNNQSILGVDSLLDFDIRLAFGEGEELSKEDWQELLKSTGNDNLVKIRGNWVQIDKDKLEAVLEHWKMVQKASKNGISIAESLRLLAGSGTNFLKNEDDSFSEQRAEWTKVEAGSWLKNILNKLRDPQNFEEKFIETTLKSNLKATLRPYQLNGVKWMWLLYQLKLGGCLADDMGLGKTIQVLSLLLLIKAKSGNNNQKPHLLVLPASLIGNWEREIKNFSPALNFLIAHPSANSKISLNEINLKSLQGIDVVLTSYAVIHRLPWIHEVDFDLAVLDEAQQIKNPGTKQTQSVKKVKSQVRLILTGTPIENRLGDLWSLFDFTSPGLLGTAQMFSNYVKNAGKDSASPQYSRFISTLRGLTSPYILRRLKSDKKIITDLPDKTEMQTFCQLSKEQLKLYKEAVDELVARLKETEKKGIERRGLVLSYLLRFKQLCNHPKQWHGLGDYQVEASGKFQRLKEICEEIAARQEKVLVFTQFKEIIPAIAVLLSEVFGRQGLILHGETPVKKRSELVESFQQERGPPFFVLSLKAGGTGLTLTRASHVIHFDRWWNPAVENQATDRAYRIGQKHPVMVHKFICQGTIEEKIDQMISMKQNLSNEMLGNELGSEISLTEMSDDDLIKMISLDIHQTLN